MKKGNTVFDILFGGDTDSIGEEVKNKYNNKNVKKKKKNNKVVAATNNTIGNMNASSGPPKPVDRIDDTHRRQMEDAKTTGEDIIKKIEDQYDTITARLETLNTDIDTKRRELLSEISKEYENVIKEMHIEVTRISTEKLISLSAMFDTMNDQANTYTSELNKAITTNNTYIDSIEAKNTKYLNILSESTKVYDASSKLYNIVDTKLKNAPKILEDITRENKLAKKLHDTLVAEKKSATALKNELNNTNISATTLKNELNNTNIKATALNNTLIEENTRATALKNELKTVNVKSQEILTDIAQPENNINLLKDTLKDAAQKDIILTASNNLATTLSNQLAAASALANERTQKLIEENAQGGDILGKLAALIVGAPNQYPGLDNNNNNLHEGGNLKYTINDVTNIKYLVDNSKKIKNYDDRGNIIGYIMGYESMFGGTASNYDEIFNKYIESMGINGNNKRDFLIGYSRGHMEGKNKFNQNNNQIYDIALRQLKK